MLNNKSFLAIIPARAGSKRLKNKNILELSGRPLISWSIHASINSKYIDKTIVTTDSEDVKEIALNDGAEVPFIRPKALSSDTAIREDVILHTLKYLKEEKNEKFDYFIYLQPTSPLRNEMHIDNSIEYLFEKKANAVVSVCPVEHPIEWIGILPENKDMTNFINKLDIKTRSQDFPIRYRLNGAIFTCDTDKFIESKSIFSNNHIFAYEMPQSASIDIDNEIDFMFARTMLKNKS
jgi:CMP-N,N'-diacetyllegionaminic acid synthase